MTNNKFEMNQSDSIDVNQPQSDWDNAFTSGQHITYKKSTTQLMKEKEQRDLAAAAESADSFNHSFIQGVRDHSNDQRLINNLTKVLEEE